MKKADRFPRTLPLKPGLRWKGELNLMSDKPTADGRYAVEFNAEVAKPQPGATENFIFDHALLTPKQLEDWTGWKAPVTKVQP